MTMNMTKNIVLKCDECSLKIRHRLEVISDPETMKFCPRCGEKLFD